MFTNIILFIIAIFVFHISQESVSKGDSLISTLSLLGTNYLVFAFYCRFRFQRFVQRLQNVRYWGGSTANIYQGLVLQLSVIALGLFALDLYFLDLAYWLQQIPGFKLFLFLQGITAIALFILYLGAIWFFSQPAHQIVFEVHVSRRNFLFSHFRLNMPILIPWTSLILLSDLLQLLPWPGPAQFFNSFWGQIISACVLMLFLLIFFLPRYIPYWWDCKPFPASAKLQELELFLKSKGFKYRGLLSWPLFEGRMLTAGIMGIIPRYRYLLVTNGLMEVLSVDELKAVLAHEMGHARYYHMLLYFFFIMVFIIPFSGAEIFLGMLSTLPPIWLKFIGSYLSSLENLRPLMIYLPLLLLLLLYFRFVLGYFMRHFERQADLYSASVMETPAHTINSLEKIAVLSGKIRDLPSWHHFSIRERVEYLERSSKDPKQFSKYNRFIIIWVGFCFIGMIALGYLLNFSPSVGMLKKSYAIHYFQEKLQKEPDNVPLLHLLAEIYGETNQYSEAINSYEKIITLNEKDATALNNLAWLLVTVQDKNLRDMTRALDLAKKAVALEKNATFLDTLAEAYYANGFKKEAIAAAREALNLATDNIPFYKKQAERFESGK
jgi:tetratricopeptide (TPR) repeat protein